MRHILLATLASLSLAVNIQTAIAQPAPQPSAQSKTAFALPPESITITSVKPSEETIRNFVETRAAPTRFLNQMARWRRPICPLTVGLGDKYAIYVTQRIRDVAAAVGAPVNADPGCRPNIEVVFTKAPQGLMDNVRKTATGFLGYYNGMSQADELAKVTHPIQAWYTTESLDIDGSQQIDSGRCVGAGAATNTFYITPGEMDVFSPIRLDLFCARVMHWNGSRLNNGYDSGFYNVLIVADPTKLFDYEVGSLADYVTMLALSQTASLDGCQELPSISNLLANGCGSVPSRITDGDLAYLKGLYRVPNGYSLSGQRDEMLFQMKKTLVTDKGR